MTGDEPIAEAARRPGTNVGTMPQGGERRRLPLFPTDRIAVSALFFLNGLIVGSWAPKIPVFASRLGLSEAALGLMILGFGMGSLAAMPVVGGLVARFGSSSVLRAASALLLPALLLLTLATNIPLAVAAIVFFGATAGGMDIAMNANAIVVERGMGRAIMSSCHGFWSLGGLAGAASGGALISAVGPLGHVIAITVLGAMILVAAAPRIAGDRTHHPAGAREPIRLPKTRLPYLIGIVALFSMVPEGAVLDWGALFLRRELGADLTASGFAFGAFSAMMALMRFAGDAVRDRLGAVLTLRICAFIAFAGMLAAGLAPDWAVATVGFALAGVGLSNVVPIAFSAAGNVPGSAPGVALSVVTSMGYSGILLAPFVIGFVAQHTSFAAVFTALPALFLVILGLSSVARHADRTAA